MLDPLRLLHSILFQLKSTFDSFTEFYTHQHSGRKLTWLHQHSKGDLQTLFTKPKYILHVKKEFFSSSNNVFITFDLGLDLSNGSASFIQQIEPMGHSTNAGWNTNKRRFISSSSFIVVKKQINRFTSNLRRSIRRRIQRIRYQNGVQSSISRRFQKVIIDPVNHWAEAIDWFSLSAKRSKSIWIFRWNRWNRKISKVYIEISMKIEKWSFKQRLFERWKPDKHWNMPFWCKKSSNS